MKHKQTTWTTLVLEHLRAQDDFLTAQQLAEAIPGVLRRQVDAALHMLRHYHCVDVIIQPDGRGWWFALPTHEDTRSKVILERTPESKPRRKRHTAKKEPK